MAVGSKHLQSQTYTAATGLSASTQQFTVVKLLPGDAVGPITADTDVPLGVLQNSPRAGESAVVAIAGFTKLRAGATDITGTPRLAYDAAGRAIAVVAGTSTGYYPIGRIILAVDNADNDGGLLSAVIDCFNPCRNF